jgi:hypothetical protein
MPAPERHTRSGTSAPYRAVAQRRLLVSRIRSLSFAAAAVAVAATAGFAADFAQAIPGHASTASRATGQGGTPAASPVGTPAASQPSRASSASAHSLAPPAQPPSSTPAAPVTSSGGS